MLRDDRCALGEWLTREPSFSSSADHRVELIQLLTRATDLELASIRSRLSFLSHAVADVIQGRLELAASDTLKEIDDDRPTS